MNSAIAHTRKMIVLRLELSGMGKCAVRLEEEPLRRRAVAVGGEPYQRAFHIVKQTRPRTGRHAAAGHEHIVETWGRQLRKQEARGLAQAALGAVALDGAADALGGGEAGADQRRVVA